MKEVNDIKEIRMDKGTYYNREVKDGDFTVVTIHPDIVDEVEDCFEQYAEHKDREHINWVLDILCDVKRNQNNVQLWMVRKPLNSEPDGSTHNKDLTDFQKENPKSASQTSLNPDNYVSVRRWLTNK